MHLLLFVVILAVAGGFFIGKTWQGQPSVGDLVKATASPSPEVEPPSEVQPQTGSKIFKFHNFHGVDLGSAGFEFQYPADWYNDNQYFSPQKIKYYDITSTDAPVYYDLISKDILDTGDLKHQIITDKRRG